MKNTLKFALIIVGVVLIGYGICTIFFPEVLLAHTTTQIDSNAQPFAMIGLGCLSLLSGLAFKKR